MDWEELVEQEVFYSEGLKWVNVHDNGEELYLDFLIDDEDGDGYSDDGESVGLDREQIEQLTFEPTYENFHEFRELVRSVRIKAEAIKIANAQLTSK